MIPRKIQLYSFYNFSSYRLKIDSRIRQLSEVLMNELRVSPDKSLQGGPRAASRAVLLLSRLGQASQACDLFLKHRSALLKHNLRQLKTEGGRFFMRTIV